MRQTLFYIPHEIFGLPVFGFGWAALAWLIFTAVLLFWLVRKQGWNEETLSYLPVLLVLGFAATILLPWLEESRMGFAEGVKLDLGLPIRGYGVFLLLAVVAGIWLAVYRGQLMGVDPEIILSLAFVMFVFGILGARGVYVFQYWHRDFATPDATAAEILKRVLDVSKGGLVVFGSLIGGLGAALVFCYLRKASFLAIADLIAPSLVLGLAIGRIGCLMNGCCYGSVCDRPWALEFPAGENAGTPLAAPTSPSPPYAHQLGLGQLHGFRIGDEEGKVVVREVVPGSTADKAGLRAGDVILIVNGLRTDKPLRRADGRTTSPYSAAQSQLQRLHDAQQYYTATREGPPPELIVITGDDRRLDLTLRDAAGAPTLPAFSLPAHPTQIYAAVNGALLTLLLLAYYPFRRHDGEVIALLLTLYPITRIAEEMIRDDESKSYFLGMMTISQAISAGLLLAAAALWIYVLTRPAGRAFPPEENAKAAA